MLSYEPIREQEDGLLIESISQSAFCGVVVDQCIAFTTGVIFRIAFGKPFKGDGFHELVSEAGPYWEAIVLLSFFQFLLWGR